MPSACGEGKTSYLCSPLRDEGLRAWERKRFSVGRIEKKKKKFSEGACGVRNSSYLCTRFQNEAREASSTDRVEGIKKIKK
ncbi:hypothetical protein EFA69_12845, partial [Rufibacter immobilis]